MAPRSKAEIELRFPALQPISGYKKAWLPPRGTQYSGRHWSRMAGLERRGPEGRPGPERKESSRQGDFPDTTGSWWGKWRQLTHTGQGQRTVLVCWEQLLGQGCGHNGPPTGGRRWGNPDRRGTFARQLPEAACVQAFLVGMSMHMRLQVQVPQRSSGTRDRRQKPPFPAWVWMPRDPRLAEKNPGWR